MDFEKVIEFLQNRDKCEDFVLRLKLAGPNSKPALNLLDAMTELQMNKTPHGIDEKTMLQHTFQFTEADECFKTFRLVCKSWKDAVETIRFNRIVEPDFFCSLDEKLYFLGRKLSKTQGKLQIPHYYVKYLNASRKIEIEISNLSKASEIFSLIVKSTKKLNQIKFNGIIMNETCKRFITQMVKNSQHTLQILYVPDLSLVSKISLPKLKILALSKGTKTSLNKFQTHFPIALKNMEHLETVYLCHPFGEGVLEFIGQNYAKHCINMPLRTPDPFVYFGVQIFETYNLRFLENKRYISDLQYLCVSWWNSISEDFPLDDWDRYRDIFDQCTNLKEIELLENGKSIVKMLPKFKTTKQQIWKERISYFNSRQIRIASRGEIGRNQKLKSKLAKEAGVSWKFDFF